MGFLDRIKRIFAGEPEAAEEISMENIEEWLGKKRSAAKDFLEGQLAGIRAGAAEEISSSKQNIEALRTAQLRNPNIPEKAKHFMEGNRESYIRWTLQLLDSIAMPERAEEVSQFIPQFNKKLDDFSKQTIRPFAILKEFFEEEASRIAQNIKSLDTLAADAGKAAEASRIKEMDSIAEHVSKMKTRSSLKKELESEKAKKEYRIAELEKDNKRIEEDISSKENSREYKDYQDLKQDMADARKESAAKEDELKHIFASLERPMRKYERIIFNDKELFAKYIESPTEALAHDFGFKIVHILRNMKKSIEENAIELKDKQREKAFEDIESLNKEFLSKFIAEYAQLRKKENDLAKRMKEFTIQGELAKLGESLSIASAMLGKAKKDLESISSEAGKIDIEEMKEELIQKIKQGLKISAVIS